MKLQIRKRKEAIDARNEADSIVFQTEKALEEAGNKVDPTEKAAVEADLKDLKDIVEATKDQDMTDAQVEDQKAKKDKLMTSAQNLLQRCMNQQHRLSRELREQQMQEQTREQQTMML